MPIDKNILERLQQNDPHLKELELRFKFLKDEDVVQLIKALSQNTNLISLDISYNSIGNEARQLLKQMLERNKKHQREQRNRFIQTIHKGLLKVNESIITEQLLLPPELINHIGSFLDANFYFQLAAIKHPSSMGKTAQQIYQCALFLLHRFAIGQLAEGTVIEQKPNKNERLSYRRHFLFKPSTESLTEQGKPEQKSTSVTPSCFMQ